MTTTEVGKLLGVGRKAVSVWCSAGGLKSTWRRPGAYGNGPAYRWIAGADLIDWLMSRRGARRVHPKVLEHVNAYIQSVECPNAMRRGSAA